MGESLIDTLVADGSAALRAGNRQRAYELLAQAVHKDPNNEQAWLWLSGAVNDNIKRQVCLERVLRINPHNEMARRGLTSLAAAAAATPPTQSAPLRKVTAPQTTPNPLNHPVEDPQPSPPPPPQSLHVAVTLQQSETPVALPQPTAPPLAQPPKQPSLFERLVEPDTVPSSPLPPSPMENESSAQRAESSAAVITLPNRSASSGKNRSNTTSVRMTWFLVGAIGVILMVVSALYAFIIVLHTA